MGVFLNEGNLIGTYKKFYTIIEAKKVKVVKGIIYRSDGKNYKLIIKLSDLLDIFIYGYHLHSFLKELNQL